jgi:hypothetical protein
MHYVPRPESRRPAAARDRSRLQSLAMIAVFDIAGPLIAYWLLRSNGLSAVTSLVLSGVFPAFGVAINFIRDRRLDAIGVLVLAGIVVGTVLGLVSGNPRLVLVEGSVPTAVFGVLCLGSLWSSAPLMYRFASEFIGLDTPRGREFQELSQNTGPVGEGFRHVFRVMTIGWGIGFLAEAAARVVIVELTSTGTAFAVSKVLPYVVAGVLAAWTFGYGNWSRRRGERAGVLQAAGVQPTPVTGDTGGPDVSANPPSP